VYGYDDDHRWHDLNLSDRERGIVISVCQKFQNRRDELDDLIQDALVALYQAMRNREARGHAAVKNRPSFIYRVVMNTMVYRYIQVAHRDVIYKSINPGAPDNSISIGRTPTIEDYAEHAAETAKRFCPERDMILRETLAGLSPRERRILNYYGEEDATQADIAQKMGICQASVSNILRKCRRRITEALVDV
jgi:RNA polymerase sigma factor (sigma-70 family)